MIEREEIRNHKLSRTPNDLLSIKENRVPLDNSLRHAEKIQPSELEIMPSFRKGVVYSRDLPLGHVLEPADPSYARHSNSNFPNFDSVLGKRQNELSLLFTQQNLMTWIKIPKVRGALSLLPDQDFVYIKSY